MSIVQLQMYRNALHVRAPTRQAKRPCMPDCGPKQTCRAAHHTPSHTHHTDVVLFSQQRHANHPVCLALHPPDRHPDCCLCLAAPPLGTRSPFLPHIHNHPQARVARSTPQVVAQAAATEVKAPAAASTTGPSEYDTFTLTTWLLKEEASGRIDNELATVISSIASACKQIASLVNRAGLSDLTGVAGVQNVQGATGPTTVL